MLKGKNMLLKYVYSNNSVDFMVTLPGFVFRSTL